MTNKISVPAQPHATTYNVEIGLGRSWQTSALTSTEGPSHHFAVAVTIQQASQLTWPQSAMTTALAVLPDCEPTPSIFFTISMPSVTLPKTTCLPSSHAVLTVHRKNCEPLVLGPAFAMERMPGPVCFNVKFSSANLAP